MSPNGIIRIFICLATLAGATLVSCRRTGHEEPVPGTGTERPDDVRVSFRIALGSTNGTRAGGTPEGSYDDGTQSEFENGIDLGCAEPIPLRVPDGGAYPRRKRLRPVENV